MKTRGMVLDPEMSVDLEPDALTLYDMSRFQNNGTMLGAGEPNAVRLPRGTWVWDYDGANDYMDCGSILSDWNTNWTIEIWASYNATPPAQTGLVSNRFGAGAAHWFSFGADNAGLLVELHHSTPGQLYLTGGVDIRGAGWQLHHLVKEGIWVSLYSNAVLRDSDSHALWDLGGATNDVYVGRWFGAAQIWDGYLSPPKIYNYALTAGQFLQRFELTRRLFGV